MVHDALPTESCTPAVPNLFGTRNRFYGRQFFHGRGGVGNVHAQFTVGFLILRESNVPTDLTRGGAQAVMRRMVSGYKYR